MGGLLGRKTFHTEGPKVANFQINASTYGLTVPVIFGTTRIAGNVIDWYDFTQIAHTTTQKTGKGGGSKVTHTEYTYTVACLIGLCEGAVAGTGRVWKDKEIINNVAERNLLFFMALSLRIRGITPKQNILKKHCHTQGLPILPG